MQAARPINDTFVTLENNTAVAFSKETAQESSSDSAFFIGDHELANFLSLEPDLPMAIGAKSTTAGNQTPCLVHTIGGSLDRLVFRFQVAPAQSASPGTRQLLDQAPDPPSPRHPPHSAAAGLGVFSCYDGLDSTRCRVGAAGIVSQSISCLIHPRLAMKT